MLIRVRSDTEKIHTHSSTYCPELALQNHCNPFPPRSLRTLWTNKTTHLPLALSHSLTLVLVLTHHTSTASTSTNTNTSWRASEQDTLRWCSIESCGMYMYIWYVGPTFFARVCNFTCGTVSWGSYMTGTCLPFLE